MPLFICQLDPGRKSGPPMAGYTPVRLLVAQKNCCLLLRNLSSVGMKSITLIIRNARQVLTMRSDQKGPRTGEHMEDLGIINDAAVAVSDGKIVAAGRSDQVLDKVKIDDKTRIIDAKDKVVLPGFVDCHTHPVFAATREAEFEMRVKGRPYQEIAGGGVGKSGNLAANAAALIMLGASGIQTGKYIMQAAAGCLGSESDRCNICNIGRCPRGITSQDPRLYRRLDTDKVAERVVDLFLAFDTELKKIVAPLGRSTALPIGMSDALGISDYDAAKRLKIKYVV